MRRPKEAFQAKGGLPDGALGFFKQVTLDRSMAATAEKKQAGDHFGSESLWIPAGGVAREEKKKEKMEKREESPSKANLNERGQKGVT